MHRIKWVGTLVSFVGVVAVSLFLLSRCGKATVTANSYVTSSNKGDLATFSFSGNTLSVTWVMTHAGTGVTDKTLTISASCAAVDATYGSRDCTVTAATCAAGAATCSASDAPQAGSIFRAVEAPGIGLLVLTPDSSQLFAGITAGTCAASVTGTYLAVHLGVGQQNLLSLFSPNAAFDTLTKADFRMTGTSNVASATLNYDGTGSTPNVMTLTGTTCANGIRSFTAGGAQLSATLAQNGMFVIDQPAGQGGILAFDVTNAAKLADLSSKTMHGIAFPDNGTPIRMAIKTGAVSGTQVPISSVQFDSATPPPSAAFIETFGGTTSPFTGTAAPVTYSTGAAYSANSFYAKYPDLSTVPGLFHVPPASGDHGNVIAAAMTINGKTLMFGAVWNDRASAPAGVTSVPTATAFPNTGAFIAFE